MLLFKILNNLQRILILENLERNDFVFFWANIHIKDKNGLLFELRLFSELYWGIIHWLFHGISRADSDLSVKRVNIWMPEIRGAFRRSLTIEKLLWKAWVLWRGVLEQAYVWKLLFGRIDHAAELGAHLNWRVILAWADSLRLVWIEWVYLLLDLEPFLGAHPWLLRWLYLAIVISCLFSYLPCLSNLMLIKQFHIEPWLQLFVESQKPVSSVNIQELPAVSDNPRRLAFVKNIVNPKDQ